MVCLLLLNYRLTDNSHIFQHNIKKKQSLFHIQLCTRRQTMKPDKIDANGRRTCKGMMHINKDFKILTVLDDQIIIHKRIYRIKETTKNVFHPFVPPFV